MLDALGREQHSVPDPRLKQPSCRLFGREHAHHLDVGQSLAVRLSGGFGRHGALALHAEARDRFEPSRDQIEALTEIRKDMVRIVRKPMAGMQCGGGSVA